MMFLRRAHHDTSSGQFDREVFDEKMKTFEALVHGPEENSSEIYPTPTTNDDDILSLDDSVMESPVPVKKPSAPSGNKGALEETLMISPVKRTKKPQKSPVSSSSRKGLSRFLRLHNLQEADRSRSERNLGDLEAVWQCSDIMSVAASIPGIDLDADDHHTVKTLATFDPSSSKRSPGMLRRSTKAAFVAREDDVLRSPASRSGNLDTTGKERKRSKSLEPATISSNARNDDDAIPSIVDSSMLQKTLRRKLKKKGMDPLSQSDHVITMVSPVPCLTPPDRDTKSSRVLIRSKASGDQALPMIPSTSPSIHGKVINGSPKDPKEKAKKKKTTPKQEKTKTKVDDDTSNKEVLIIMSPETEVPGKKKKRSKSLSRLNLYDHESVDKTKRDPSRRRGGKKERRASIAGDDPVEQSLTRRSAGSVSCAGEGQKLRLSRRQLMKMMDNESVISAPACAGTNGRSIGRSVSPRPGRLTSTLPRRRDSERGGLGSSLHRQGSTKGQLGLDTSRHDLQEQSVEPVSPTKLPRRGDSLRNLGNSATSGPSSVKTPRRKLSATAISKSGPEDRSELLKRIDSVNSFFGQGNGEVGSAYPSNLERNLGQEGGKLNRPAQPDKGDKERNRRSYRNLSAI